MGGKAVMVAPVCHLGTLEWLSPAVSVTLEISNNDLQAKSCGKCKRGCKQNLLKFQLPCGGDVKTGSINANDSLCPPHMYVEFGGKWAGRNLNPPLLDDHDPNPSSDRDHTHFHEIYIAKTSKSPCNRIGEYKFDIKNSCIQKPIKLFQVASCILRSFGPTGSFSPHVHIPPTPPPTFAEMIACPRKVCQSLRWLGDAGNCSSTHWKAGIYLLLVLNNLESLWLIGLYIKAFIKKIHTVIVEQVSVLYQNINIVEPRLIQPYEHVIKNFIREIKLQSTEMENLAIAVKRAQDKAAIQLGELEEEMDQRIQAAEHRIQKEEKRKAEEALNDLKRQYEAEVGDLQVTIKKLKMLEEQSRNISHKEDLTALKTRIHDLTLENQKLKKDLMEAQTNIAYLQSELDTLKSDIADQSLNSERDLDMIRGYTEDRDSLERQIEILQLANRKLHDSNDGLRSALENSWSVYNRSLRLTNISPGNTLCRSSPKSGGGQSPQNPQYDRSSHSSYVDEDYDSLALCDPMQRINGEVDSLPESCFDSGMSTLRDSNEYDSEVESKHQRISQRSQCPQESFPGDASDTDVPDIRDEEVYTPDEARSVLDWKPAQPVSRSNSGASTRKCIPVISPQSDSADCSSRYPSSEKAYKIVLAGDAAVGKSSFLMRLCKNEFRGNTSATLGVDFQMKRLIVDGEPTVLQLWDTAGQESASLFTALPLIPSCFSLLPKSIAFGI
ncbi:Ras and EF-hand domain-containing protein [Varanus komodoensis]|nr:Ras and EF-hand domain-containing protein [Varanus komodoensis]